MFLCGNIISILIYFDNLCVFLCVARVVRSKCSGSWQYSILNQRRVGDGVVRRTSNIRPPEIDDDIPMRHQTY